ncbi:MAG: FAD binding domain-containing protein [Actinomycetota bacterium]
MQAHSHSKTAATPASAYAAPTEVTEAVRLLAADGGARVLAGGTDLLVQMRTGGRRPPVFVDIKRIPRAATLTVDADGARVGAAVPAAEIFEHAEFRRRWPGLAEATDLIGSTQIQGRATLAGNLCNASPAADSVPALIACGAAAVVAGPDGERHVPVEAFTTGPGRTVLGASELLVEIEVPNPAPRSADAYLRLIPRTEMDIAVVGAGVQLALSDDGETIAAARVARGAVAPPALLVTAAADARVGSRADDAALERAGAAASAAADPISDRRGTVEYRERIAAVLTRRAARIAYERARARD